MEKEKFIFWVYEFFHIKGSKVKNNRIISLGTNCATRYFLTKAGIKPAKDQGELSMPFDLAIHFPRYIPYLIKTKFKKYLSGIMFDEKTKNFKISLKKHWWNKKQNVAYLNHDNDLGKDVSKIRLRYKNRIQNFLTVLNSKEKLFFVQSLESPYNPMKLL